MSKPDWRKEMRQASGGKSEETDQTEKVLGARPWVKRKEERGV